MARQRDPVCGMMVESARTFGPVTYRERTYYFCSDECLEQFNASPERYTREQSSPVSSSREPHREETTPEPPFTTDGITAPKFGAAGSGGLEYELPPRKESREEE
ncbi:MAG TPA: YHS domain-containing protein [Gemmatimonadaceae bacterium]|nr:YHS domain-containing protein [Gemmatimonadaceae bacterium]